MTKGRYVSICWFCCSVTQLCPTLCDSIDCSMPGFPVLHYLLEFASLVAQMVKHLSTMRETWVRSLGQEDPLEKEMATHSSNLAWKIPWKEECGRLQSMGSQRVGHNWATFTSCVLSPWCHPTISSSVTPLSLPSIFPSIRVISNESALCNRWPKCWSFQWIFWVDFL